MNTSSITRNGRSSKDTNARRQSRLFEEWLWKRYGVAPGMTTMVKTSLFYDAQQFISSTGTNTTPKRLTDRITDRTFGLIREIDLGRSGSVWKMSRPADPTNMGPFSNHPALQQRSANRFGSDVESSKIIDAMELAVEKKNFVKATVPVPNYPPYKAALEPVAKVMTMKVAVLKTEDQETEALLGLLRERLYAVNVDPAAQDREDALEDAISLSYDALTIIQEFLTKLAEMGCKTTIGNLHIEAALKAIENLPARKI